MLKSKTSLPLLGLALGLAVIGAGSVTLLGQNTGRFRVLMIPEATGTSSRLSKELLRRERDAAASGESRPVNVIVRLSGDPLATYDGAIADLPATNPRRSGSKKLNARSAESQRYMAHLARGREDFKGRVRGAIPSARLGNEYQAILNGLSVTIPDTAISVLASLPGVDAVYEDVLLQPDTDASPSFIGAPSVWNQLGGQYSAGENVVVGVIDTGIWPEHPSFSDPDPSGKPYGPLGGPVLPCTFGSAVTGDAAFTCNNKLIGARTSLATYAAIIGFGPGEFPTTRDDEGHGTHTASTAAGNGGVNASIFGRSFGVVSGIAPRAKVIAYKACGTAGCFSSDSVTAINTAVLDGVDVINYSISGGASPYSDAVSLAFLGAYEAGVFVAASAGNAGPAANSTDHREPWTTTVAASTTNRQFQGVLTLSQGAASLTLRGASVTPGLASSAPVVVAGTPLCSSPFAPGTFTGKIVVCQRGGNSRVSKGFNVLQGGAVGMILYNPTLQGLATDNHFLPAVHLENTDGASLLSFLTAHPGTTATMTAGAHAAAQGDVMAAFSSRGGSLLTLGVSKPDITAPGVQMLAGNTPLPSSPDGGKPGQLFQAIQGTSMSSPHIAGSAALLADLHPAWTPGQIRSALMTTATPSVVKEDGTTPATSFDFGSGRVDLNRADDPGFLIDESAANYVAFQSHLWDANYPSVFVPGFPGEITVRRTLHNARSRRADWKVRVFAPSNLDVNVPKNINIPGSGDATLDINLDGRGLANGQSAQAVIEFSRPGEATLRMPVAVVRGASVVPLTKTCSPLTIQEKQATNCTITITNTTFTPASVVLNDTLEPDLKLVKGSVVNTTPPFKAMGMVAS